MGGSLRGQDSKVAICIIYQSYEEEVPIASASHPKLHLAFQKETNSISSFKERSGSGEMSVTITSRDEVAFVALDSQSRHLSLLCPLLLFEKKKISFILSVGALLHACMYGGLIRASGHLQLESQIIVNHRVLIGTQTQVIGKSNTSY